MIESLGLEHSDILMLPNYHMNLSSREQSSRAGELNERSVFLQKVGVRVRISVMKFDADKRKIASWHTTCRSSQFFGNGPVLSTCSVQCRGERQ
jgi:hypothetical protein